MADYWILLTCVGVAAGYLGGLLHAGCLTLADLLQDDTPPETPTPPEPPACKTTFHTESDTQCPDTQNAD